MEVIRFHEDDTLSKDDIALTDRDMIALIDEFHGNLQDAGELSALILATHECWGWVPSKRRMRGRGWGKVVVDMATHISMALINSSSKNRP